VLNDGGWENYYPAAKFVLQKGPCASDLVTVDTFVVGQKITRNDGMIVKSKFNVRERAKTAEGATNDTDRGKHDCNDEEEEEETKTVVKNLLDECTYHDTAYDFFANLEDTSCDNISNDRLLTKIKRRNRHLTQCLPSVFYQILIKDPSHNARVVEKNAFSYGEETVYDWRRVMWKDKEMKTAWNDFGEGKDEKHIVASLKKIMGFYEIPV
jgi:hypothetical protein